MMATFRDSEKQRYQMLKGYLFSAAACRPGAYNQRPREFCLADECAAESLLTIVEQVSRPPSLDD
jgi:hypothetical protein